MLKVISIIGTVLTFLYSRNKYDLDFINKLFYMPNNKEFFLTSKIIPKHKTPIPFNNINENSNNATSLTNSELVVNLQVKSKINNICSSGKAMLNKEVKVFKNKEENNFQIPIQNSKMNKSRVHLSFFQLFFFQVKNKKHKERDNLLTKGIKIIMKRLDIISYFIENVNFQRIKSLLLTKEQYYLFNSPNRICLGEKGNTELYRNQYAFNTTGRFFTNQSVIDALNPNLA